MAPVGPAVGGAVGIMAAVSGHTVSCNSLEEKNSKPSKH